MSGEEATAALVAALTKVLTDVQQKSTTTLKYPTFDWNSTDKYEDFQIFIESTNSWFKLQKIPEEADATAPTGVNDTRLEYVLSFLGATGRKKHKSWNPSGTTEEEKKKKKASAKEFMEYLLSTMDHEVSQRCRIYQLEDVRIQAGETPDELVERLRALAARCNFPTDEEMERNVQYRFVRALNDKELVRKLLALKLDATTADMVTVCNTHIAIADNCDAMGLSGSKTVHSIHHGKPKQRHHGQKGRPPTRSNNHQCGNCTQSHAPGRKSCPAKDATCHTCGKTGHWKQRCRSGPKSGPSGGSKPPSTRGRGGKGQHQKTHPKRINEVGTDFDPQLDEVRIASISTSRE